MTTRGGGRPTKDDKISNNFNPKKRRGYVPTQSDLLQAKLEAQIEADNKTIAEKEIESLMAQVAEIRKAAGIANVAKSTPKTEDDRDDDQDDRDDMQDSAEDARNAYQMLKDMRWVYREVKGRKKLKDLMTEDKQFVTLAKELMKVETALLTARIRTKQAGKQGTGRQSFFVVLKGLETEKPILAAMNAGAIDLKQISNALNPQEVTRYEAAEEKSSRSKPEEIVRVAKIVETETEIPNENPNKSPAETKPSITIQDVENWG